MNVKIVSLTGAIALAVASGQTFADSKFGLGIGVASKTNVYEEPDDDNMTGALPLINYQSDLFYVKGLEAGVHITPIEILKLAAFINGQAPAYEEDDADSLEDFDDREFTTNVGVSATVFLKIGDADFGEVTLRAMTEASDEHEAEEADLSYSKTIMFSEDKFHVKPYLGINYLAEDKAVYNYGVTGDDVGQNAFATFYEPTDSMNPYVGVEVGMRIGKNHLIVGGVESMQLDDSIEDSPIVEEDAIMTASVGYIYNF